MPRILTDDEITARSGERKGLPANWAIRLKPNYRPDDPCGRRTFPLTGDYGSKFRIHLRDNRLIVFDFSIILMFIDHEDQEYTLTRFNGKHPSQHTNKIEKKLGLPNAFFRNVFHIHLATERYQREGYPIDGYAEPTDRYGSFDSALRAFVQSNGCFIEGSDGPLPLFDNDHE